MTKSRKWIDNESTTYHGTLPAVQPWQERPVYQGRRETPITGTMETDVIIPGKQALYVSVAIGQAVGAVTLAIVLIFRWPWYLPLMTGLLTTSLLAALKMTVNIEARRKVQKAIETILRTDLDGDGFVGEPSLTVEVVDHQRRKTNFVDLGISEEKAIAFARGVMGGRGLAINEWIGRGGLCTRPEFERLRAKLLEAGLARWVNVNARNQGVTLTRKGVVTLGELAKVSPTELD